MENTLSFIALWRDGQTDGDEVLHLFTKDAHQKIPFPKIATITNNVEEFLPQIVQFLPAKNDHSRWVLLLEPSLPESWIHLNWETLKLQGQPVSSHALVVRSAIWNKDKSQTKKTNRFFLDLFPQSEFSFGSELQPLIKSGVLRKGRINLLQEQMSEASDILIMAHGRACGLVNADDNRFEIPVSHPMPSRIWLLACGVNGAMNKLAQQLLEQGCHTVIAATSQISAPEIQQFVENMLDDERINKADISWLSKIERATNGEGSLRSLTVWGSIDLETTSCSKWNKLTWDIEHGDWCQPPLNDVTTSATFIAAYEQAMSAQAWPQTRKWMVTPLLWLAEIHHHPALEQLTIEVGDLKTPEAIRGHLLAARRVGNYPQMARYLSLGLNIPDLTEKEKSDYLGDLANLYIDLNLPESAAAAISLHEDCDLDDPKEGSEAYFRRLDWKARTEARSGKLYNALSLMTAKRKKAKTDTGRELAWQLYLASWGFIAEQVPMETLNKFAEEIAKRLESVSVEDVGYGNETIAYLLRAIAVYTWATKDAEHLSIVKKWLVHAEKRLTDDDPGPWAYTIIFLYLQKAASIESYEQALCALERAKYTLEVAFLSGFGNRDFQYCRLLEKFQNRRHDVLVKANNFGDKKNATIIDESALRIDDENNSMFSPKRAALLGTLPL
jgi:hypothetical protein